MSKKKPDKLLINHLQREQGISKGNAALQLLNTRKSNQRPAEEKPKENVDKNQMPYAPEKIYLPLREDGTIPTSTLTLEQHKRYVAIITNYLKSEKGFRFEINKLEIQGFDELLVQERNFFQTECLKKLDSIQPNPFDYLSGAASVLYKERMLLRFNEFPKEGYQKVVHSVSWPYDDTSTSGKHCKPSVEKILKTGHFPNLVLPNPRRKFRVTNDIVPVRKKLFATPSPSIETDEEAVNLALNNGLTFIMCASTLRSLLVMPWLYRDQKFAFQISIRKKLHNGRFCRYIIFSKPIITTAPNKPTLQHKFVKWILKASLIENETKIGKKRKLSEQEDDPDAKKEKVEDQVEVPTSTSDDKVQDLLGDILSEMDSSINTSANKSISDKQEDAASQSGKRYSIVNFVTEYAKKQQILVRTSNHGMDENKEHVCVTVKSDYLPAIGAERLSDEQSLWNYFTGVLKASESLVNIRFHPQSGNLLQLQRISTKEHYGSLTDANRRLISQRCERLSTLFNSINDLDYGEYLLINRDEQMEVVSRDIEDPVEKIWKSDEIIETSLNSRLLPAKKPSELWNGVDLHLPLVWHIVQGVIPGALSPLREKHKDGFKPGNQRGGFNGRSRGPFGPFRGGKRGRGRGKIGNNSEVTC